VIVKPSGCHICPLFEKGQGFCPDKTYPDADYILYGEAPGKQEIEKGEPFVGRAGWVLKQWLLKSVPLLQLAEEKHRISYCNVLRCLPPEVQGRAYPRGEERLQAEHCCSQYKNLGTAHTLVLCGEVPQRFFFHDELEKEDAEDKETKRELKGVMGRVGRVIEKEGRRYVFAPHPAFILRQPALVTHGQQALQIAANTERVVEPEYLDWGYAMGELNG